MVTSRVRTSRGFTLLELMIVVALIGVLAAIVIPAFGEDSRRAQAEAEIHAVFAELKVRQEAHKVEFGTYLSTGADEDGFVPTGTLTSKKRPWPVTLPAGMVTLRFVPPESEAYCNYVAIAGPAGGGTIGPVASGTFGMAASPVANWFYLLAHCDLDGNASKDTWGFMSSINATVDIRNPGH
jgi:prepilin-type N-terminal cleavage/methylation domain-containing protein